jgi:transcriptional regulator with XRE-family HTH domain
MNASAIAERRSKAQEIRELRRAAGITQRELAILADCSVGTIANLENGEIPKRGEVLPRVLQTLADLENDEGRPPKGAPVQESATPGRHVPA